jgi:hypothetical protein
VTATRDEVDSTAQAFLGVKGTPTPLKPKNLQPPQPKKKKRRRGSSQSIGSAGLIKDSATGKDQALRLVSEGARGLRIFYPRLRGASDTFQAPPRAYKVAVAGKLYHAYRFVVKMRGIGDYWGVQGIAWTDPPILRESSTVKQIGGRKYYIYGDGGRVRLVAWKTKDATYWVANTLSQTLSRSQMLAIAKSCKPL